MREEDEEMGDLKILPKTKYFTVSQSFTISSELFSPVLR
jgi:hypothetical protein